MSNPTRPATIAELYNPEKLYRELNRVDTLSASGSLRHVRDAGLLDRPPLPQRHRAAGKAVRAVHEDDC